MKHLKRLLALLLSLALVLAVSVPAFADAPSLEDECRFLLRYQSGGSIGEFLSNKFDEFLVYLRQAVTVWLFWPIVLLIPFWGPIIDSCFSFLF